MTDVVNLNSIRSTGCDCQKPKLQPCGCGNHPLQPYQTIDLSDLYFKVKNLFSELKSEWQRTEARSNLGITDIIGLKLIKFGEGSGDTNIWEMITSKGGSLKVYDFVVKNGEAGSPGKDGIDGEDGKSATIRFAKPYSLPADSDPEATNLGTETDAVLLLGIPAGRNGENGLDGEPGQDGKSAYEIYLETTDDEPPMTKKEWINSLGKIKRIYLGPQINNGNIEQSELGVNYHGDYWQWIVELYNGEKLVFWCPVPDYSQVECPEPIIPEIPEPIIPDVNGVLYLFKKVTFHNCPDEEVLESNYNVLNTEINSETGARPFNYLKNRGWTENSQIAVNQGRDFIYLALARTINGEIDGYWSLVQLTALSDCSGGGGGITPPDPNIPDNPNPVTTGVPVLGTDYLLDFEVAAIPNRIEKGSFVLDFGLALLVENKTNNYIKVNIPAHQFARAYVATNTDNPSETINGLFSLQYSSISVVCPPNKDSRFYAEGIYNPDTNLTEMSGGGYFTMLNGYLQGGKLDNWTEGSDTRTVNDYTFADINPNITSDGFEALTLDDKTLTYNYILPGEVTSRFVLEELQVENIVNVQVAFGMKTEDNGTAFNVNWDEYRDWKDEVSTERPFGPAEQQEPGDLVINPEE